MTTDVMDAPAPEVAPTTTGTGNPRTPSTPGRKPGQKTGTGRGRPAAGDKAPPAPRSTPAPRTKKVTDHRPAVRKSIQKLGGTLLVAATSRNQPALAADAIALLQQKEAWADCLNSLAQDTKWLAVALEKAAIIAPGVEAGSLLIALGAQIGVNHGMIPLELAKLLDAKDPRDLLAMQGIKVVDLPDEDVTETGADS